MPSGEVQKESIKNSNLEREKGPKGHETVLLRYVTGHGYGKTRLSCEGYKYVREVLTVIMKKKERYGSVLGIERDGGGGAWRFSASCTMTGARTTGS